MAAKMGLKVLYPRPSSMTKNEQRTYFELSDRYRHLSPINQEDYRLLKVIPKYALLLIYVFTCVLNALYTYQTFFQ